MTAGGQGPPQIVTYRAADSRCAAVGNAAHYGTDASSALVPVRTMPWWLYGLARSQPATPVTIRGPLLRQPLGAHLFTALAWYDGIPAVSVALSVVLFRRHTA